MSQALDAKNKFPKTQNLGHSPKLPAIRYCAYENIKIGVWVLYAQSKNNECILNQALTHNYLQIKTSDTSHAILVEPGFTCKYEYA